MVEIAGKADLAIMQVINEPTAELLAHVAARLSNKTETLDKVLPSLMLAEPELMVQLLPTVVVSLLSLLPNMTMNLVVTDLTKPLLNMFLINSKRNSRLILLKNTVQSLNSLQKANLLKRL